MCKFGQLKAQSSMCEPGQIVCKPVKYEQLDKDFTFMRTLFKMVKMNIFELVN